MIKHTILLSAGNPLGSDRLALYEEACAIQDELDCIVGMTGAPTRDAARNFAIGFYGGLAGFIEGNAIVTQCHDATATVVTMVEQMPGLRA